MTQKRIFFVLFFCLVGLVVSGTAHRHFAVSGGVQKSYPLLAMWWPDIENQPMSQLKKYDWLGLDKWDNIETVKRLKRGDRHLKCFVSFSHFIALL